jgi:hypothetical protein
MVATYTLAYNPFPFFGMMIRALHRRYVRCDHQSIAADIGRYRKSKVAMSHFFGILRD